MGTFLARKDRRADGIGFVGRSGRASGVQESESAFRLQNYSYKQEVRSSGEMRRPSSPESRSLSLPTAAFCFIISTERAGAESVAERQSHKFSLRTFKALFSQYNHRNLCAPPSLCFILPSPLAIAMHERVSIYSTARPTRPAQSALLGILQI